MTYLFYLCWKYSPFSISPQRCYITQYVRHAYKNISTGNPICTFSTLWLNLNLFKTKNCIKLNLEWNNLKRSGHSFCSICIDHCSKNDKMCVCVCGCVCVCVCTHMLSCVWLFVTPWTVAHQAPLSMEFSRQQYWNVLLLFVKML